LHAPGLLYIELIFARLFYAVYLVTQARPG
jgi:hypothetical protein